MKPPLFFLFLVVIAGSCSHTLTPQQTTEHFLHALEKKDVDKALTYVMKENREYVKIVIALKPVTQKDRWTITDVDMTDNTVAVVKVNENFGGEVPVPLRFYLKKQKENWDIINMSIGSEFLKSESERAKAMAEKFKTRVDSLRNALGKSKTDADSIAATDFKFQLDSIRNALLKMEK